MIDLHAVWNRTGSDLDDESMRIDGFAVIDDATVSGCSSTFDP